MENKEVILITGSNGLIAKQLASFLANKYTIRLLSRKPTLPNEYSWDINKHIIDEKALENVSHIIHLAGAGIADKNWTTSRKKEIVSSRVDSAKLLLTACIKQNSKLKSFISASAIGYYGQTSSEHIFTETDEHGNDFVSSVCVAWEKAADEFEQHGIAERVVKLRTGIVMAKEGGALPNILLPLQLRVALVLGNGKQYMPWIHLHDMCSIYQFAMENNHCKGVYNCVANESITYSTCIKTAKKMYQKKMLPFYMPSFLLKILLGERASLLLYGSRIHNAKILASGFSFSYNTFAACMENLIGKKRNLTLPTERSNIF
jgi:uncharacterized protein